MSNDIMHQLGQTLVENNGGFLHKVFDVVGATTTTILLYLGAVGGAFSRIFDPSTWDMTTIASFFSIPVAIMYFLAKYSEYRLNQERREIVKETQDADSGN